MAAIGCSMQTKNSVSGIAIDVASVALAAANVAALAVGSGCLETAPTLELEYAGCGDWLQDAQEQGQWKSTARVVSAPPPNVPNFGPRKFRPLAITDRHRTDLCPTICTTCALVGRRCALVSRHCALVGRRGALVGRRGAPRRPHGALRRPRGGGRRPARPRPPGS